MQGAAPSTAKMRVLCVDDSKDLPEMLELCIRAEADMECAGCLHNANDLVAEVENRRADIVVLDMSMPGKDPLEAMRELSAAHRDRGGGRGPGRGAVRVIAYSGRSEQEAVDRAREAGAYCYVSKGATIPDLMLAIREAGRENSAFKVWL
jgi:DNA-binding NarL/FixJ family response regulator